MPCSARDSRAPVGEGLVEAGDQAFFGERLGEEAEGAGAKHALAQTLLGEPGDEDHRVLSPFAMR